MRYNSYTYNYTIKSTAWLLRILKKEKINDCNKNKKIFENKILIKFLALFHIYNVAIFLDK